MKLSRIYFFLLLLILLLMSCSGCGRTEKTPGSSNGFSYSQGHAAVLAPTTDKSDTMKVDSLILDFSSKDNGYFIASLSDDVKINVQVIGPDQVVYKYFLEGRNTQAVFPFTAGDGAYIILVYENVSDTQYIPVLTQSVSVNLKNEFLPFLYPNQYVWFEESSPAIALAEELSKDAETDIDALNAIYQYITENISYDDEKAETVPRGYLPDIDQTLETKTGICFDYAALTAAMLRCLSIPSRLTIGYSGSIRHAWVDVYIESMGWVKNAIEFNGSEWKLMDPTFSAAMEDSFAAAYIGNGDNYTVEYVR